MATITQAELETLVTMLAEDGEVSFPSLGFLLWDRRRAPGPESARLHGRRRAEPLIAAGALCRARAGHVALTERGRIAAALAIARDAGLRDVFLGDDG